MEHAPLNGKKISGLQLQTECGGTSHFVVDDEFHVDANITPEALAAKIASHVPNPNFGIDATEVSWRTRLQEFIDDANTALAANNPDILTTLAVNLSTLAGNANLATTVTKVNEVVGRVNLIAGRVNELAARSNYHNGRFRVLTRALLRIVRFTRDGTKDVAL